ncbi:hypothetical protein HU200_035787 [Digitaria exilis]|uniref:Uncharacterized protein n=1 Tax=Digitaria exilis TaxID=1010633 RepID=A0A835BFT9_9POAL|nr:hypothetical protein HU200_035787 [Digitaria exilis]
MEKGQLFGRPSVVYW